VSRLTFASGNAAKEEEFSILNFERTLPPAILLAALWRSVPCGGIQSSMRQEAGRCPAGWVLPFSGSTPARAPAHRIRPATWPAPPRPRPL
jgi:hypothetical protein